MGPKICTSSSNPTSRPQEEDPTRDPVERERRITSDETLEKVIFGRLVAKGGQDIPNKYSLVTRHYIGNTSMDPALALIQVKNASAVKFTCLVTSPLSTRARFRFIKVNMNYFQANLCHAENNALILDPFVGTGSLLIAAAHYGAFCWGSEISYKAAHGMGMSSRKGAGKRGPDENVRANFVQYGLLDR